MRLAGIPLRVKPSFLVVVCLLGMPIVRHPTVEPPELIGRLAIWVGVVLVSVIIHELGHALLARRFGAEVTMELWALGGLTTWQPVSRPITPTRRAAIAAAGSALGLVVGGAVYPLWKMAGPPVGLVSLALGWIVWVNLGWGLINWLPIRLLDGGHIFRGVIDAAVAEARRSDRQHLLPLLLGGGRHRGLPFAVPDSRLVRRFHAHHGNPTPAGTGAQDQTASAAPSSRALPARPTPSHRSGQFVERAAPIR